MSLATEALELLDATMPLSQFDTYQPTVSKGTGNVQKITYSQTPTATGHRGYILALEGSGADDRRQRVTGPQDKGTHVLACDGKVTLGKEWKIRETHREGPDGTLEEIPAADQPIYRVDRVEHIGGHKECRLEPAREL